MVWGQAAARGVDDLAQRLSRNDPQLVSLTIMKNRRFGTEEVQILSSALSANTTLTELYASNHKLDPQAALALGSALASNSTLTSLCVGDPQLGDVGLGALCRGLAGGRPGLTRLDLENKGLSGAGLGPLAELLAAPGSRLRCLLLRRNSVGAQGIRSLCSSPWASLTELDLAGCQLDATAISALATATSTSATPADPAQPAAPPPTPSASTLSKLDLSGNPLGPSAGPALAALLAVAPSLVCLQLQGGGLGDAGVEAMAGALGRHGRLEVLDLADNGLTGPEGLCEALQFGCSALRDLSLAHNPGLEEAWVAGLARALGGQGAAPLARLDLAASKAGPSCLAPLSQAPRLQALSLLGCPLGQPGATELVGLLSQQQGGSVAFARLEDASLSDVGLEWEGMQAILEALGRGGAPCLTSLEVGANPACQDERIEAAVKDLRAARPGLQLHWSAVDPSGEQQRGMMAMQ